MTIVLDISCPECGQSDPVLKVGIATYRCTECDLEFDQEDVDPDLGEDTAGGTG